MIGHGGLLRAFPFARARRLQLPLDDFCRLELPHHAVPHTTDGQIPNDPPRIGANSTTTSNHPSTPGSLDTVNCNLMMAI